MPFTHGQYHVHASRVTALVESEEAILEVGLPAIGPVQEAAGRLVAERIEDGSTLQIGDGVRWRVAQLRGKSAKQRAQALIAIGHPDFRTSGLPRRAAR